MKQLLLILSILIPGFVFGQIPNINPRNIQLLYQTTGDGIVWRGGANIDYTPTTKGNAWMHLDTVNNKLYSYVQGQWSLVKAGGVTNVYMGNDTLYITTSDTVFYTVITPDSLQYNNTTQVLSIRNGNSVTLAMNTDTTLSGNNTLASKLKVNNTYVPMFKDTLTSLATKANLALKLNLTDTASVILTAQQKQLAYIKNQTGSPLTRGQVVYVSGASGDNKLVSLASSSSEATSSKTFGLVSDATIANGSNGYVITFGLLEGVNTDTFQAGAVLYLHTVSGQITDVKPVAPLHMVVIGFCVRVQQNNGAIFVKIQNGFELDELHNVSVAGLAPGKVLKYNGTLWAPADDNDNQTITLTGDVTGSGTGSFQTTLANSGVTAGTYNNSATTVTPFTIDVKGRVTGTGTPVTIAPAFSSIANKPTTLSGYGITDAVPSSRTITINGTGLDLTTNRSWSVGTVTQVNALTLGTTGTDVSSSVTNGTTTPTITLNIPTASATNRGALSPTDWTTFNSKQNAISLTTTGNSGASTLVGSTLNIPNYTLSGLGGEPAITAGTTSQYWRGDKTWQTLNTTAVTEGTNLYFTDTRARNAITLTTNNSSGAATYTNGVFNIPNYTLSGLGGISLTSLSANAPLSYNNTSGVFSIPQANGSTNGFLSSTDWTTFNNKQAQLDGTGFVKANGAIISYDNSTYLTSSSTLSANNLSGTIQSSVLGNSTTHVGTTAIALNRASANQGLTGISSLQLPGSTSGTVTLQPASTAGTTTITLPATTGTVITSGDNGTVNSTMIANATIVNEDISNSAAIAVSKLAANTISGVTLGNNLNTLSMGVSGTGLSGSATYNGSAGSTFTVTSNATNANTASTIVARDASGNFSAGTITAALNGNASTAAALQTARSINGTSFNGTQDITTANWGTARNVTIGATTRSVNGSGNVSWSLGDIQAEYQQPINTIRSSLTDPTVRQIASIHGVLNNKFRFISPNLQEESTDGINWITSTRLSSDELGDIMIGEGQTRLTTIIPPGTIGTYGGYRLTWNDPSVTGYIFLNNLYLYMSMQGNIANITIEKRSSAGNWEIVTGPHSASGWPAHQYIPHNFIAYEPTLFNAVRITFETTRATANGIILIGVEWLGAYPAGRRNVEYYDRNKNVFFPAGIRSSTDLGVGVSTPSSRFHIKQPFDNHTGGIKLERASNNNTYSMNVDASGNLNIGYAAASATPPTNLVTIASTGNVGIGTAPAAPFTLTVSGAFPVLFSTTSTANSETYGGTRFFRNVNALNNGNGFQFSFNDASNAQQEYGYFGAYIIDNNPSSFDGGFIFSPTFNSQRIEAMRILNNGNVGIGTSNPTKKLEVYGDFALTDGILMNDASGGYIGMVQATSGANDFAGELVGKALGNNPAFNLRGIQTTSSTKTTGVVQLQAANSNNTGPVEGADKAITFLNFSTEMLTVLGNGNVGIGTASPQNKLDVEGAVAIGNSYSGSSSAPTNGLIVEGNVGIGTSSVTAGTALDVNGNVRVRTLTNGTLAVDNTGVVKKEPTLRNISLGEGYADNIREFYYNNNYTVQPNSLGYRYGRLLQQNLLRDASFIFVPTALQVSKLPFQKPQATGVFEDFTYTRNTLATRVDSMGIVSTVSNNVPRINFISGDAGILIEPTRTNVIINSENVSSALPAVSSMTVALDVDIAPDGKIGASTTADRLTFGNIGAYIHRSFSQVLNNTYAGSFFFKNISFSPTGTLRFIISNNAGSSMQVVFRPFNGVVVSTSSAQYTDVNASIQAYGNGWYRVMLSGIAGASGGAGGVYEISLADDASSTRSLLVWGFQLETGTNTTTGPYATSYIPTTGGVTVTRDRDVVSRANRAELIGGVEGVIFVEVDITVKREAGDPTVGIITLNNNQSNLDNTILIGIVRGQTNTITGQVRNFGSVEASITSPTITSGLYKIALAYKNNDFALYVNGQLIGTDNSGAFIAASQILLGSRFNLDDLTLSDEIKEVHLYRTRLSNAQLAELTQL